MLKMKKNIGHNRIQSAGWEWNWGVRSLNLELLGRNIKSCFMGKKVGSIVNLELSIVLLIMLGNRFRRNNQDVDDMMIRWNFQP